MTRTVTDAAIILDAIAGKDRADNYTLGAPKPPHYLSSLNKNSLRGVRLGAPIKHFREYGPEGNGLEPSNEASFQVALTVMKSLGAVIVDVNMTNTEGLVDLDPTVMRSDFKAELDGYLQSLIS